MGLSEFLRKTFAGQKTRAGQAGQALLEYILVLILTVSIILGILYQFNDAFKTFLDNYFGDYIACLLETGELPALGGDGPSSGECVIQDMNVAGGAILDNSSSGGGGGGNSANGGDSSSSSESSSDDSGSGSGNNGSRGGRPSRFNTSGGTGNGEAVGSASTRSRPSSIRKSNRIITSGGGSQGGGFESGSSEGGFGGRRGRTIRNKRVIYLGDDYMTKDAKKKKKSPIISKAKPPKKKAGISSLKKAQFKLDVPERSVAKVKEKKTNLGFGDIIKYMLIAGILIAIFVFLGGQAMQIKKGWQKSE